MAHILIVDDEATIRYLIRTQLEFAGHSVFEAQYSRAALDILETFPKPFDIMTLNIYIPHMNGFELLALLRKQPFHPLVLTVGAHSDQIPRAVAHMVSRRLTKPFDRQTLITMMNRLVNLLLELPLPQPI